jgi:microcystin-dependent protein
LNIPCHPLFKTVLLITLKRYTMADGFVGEIRAFGFNFVPRGWVACNGATYNIASYAPLFSIIGVQFGGNGTTTFNVPDLQGKTIVGVQAGTGGFDTPGDSGGEANVTLTTATIPAHNHQVQAVTRSALAQTSAAIAQPGTNAYLTNAFCTGLSQGIIAYADTANTVMNPLTIAIAGGGTPHNNMSPFLAMSYCICVEGVFPPHP